jgi:hypothetical protein
MLRPAGFANGGFGMGGAAGGEQTVVLASGCRLRVVRADPVPAGAAGGAGTILLRPDGYVAWAGTDETGLRAALAQWFGAPPGSPP